MKTPEELQAMTPEELLKYVQDVQAESSKKDDALVGLTDQLANQKAATAIQKLKVGKQFYKMKYGAIKQDGVTYSYEALSKLKAEELAEIIKNDDGSFELIA